MIQNNGLNGEKENKTEMKKSEADQNDLKKKLSAKSKYLWIQCLTIINIQLYLLHLVNSMLY